MTPSQPRWSIVETLLNALYAERYARGPLLLTVFDELSSNDSLAPAADMAVRLVAQLDEGRISDAEFVRRVDELRAVVRGLATRPADSSLSLASLAPSVSPEIARVA